MTDTAGGAQSNGASGSTSTGGTGSTTGTSTGANGASQATGGTTQQAGGATGVPPAAGAGAPGAAGTPPPAYNPNFKFKHTNAEGKEIEQEFDDLFKPLVKSEAEEKRLREMHEKAFGLDFIKADRDKMKQTHQQTAAELTQLKGGIDQLRTFVQARDFDSFFQALQIPEQMILQYALQKAQYQKLSPEQRAAYDEQVNARRQAMMLQQQNQQLVQQATQAAVQARTLELNTVLSRPEIAAMVSAFDAKAGRPGAFQAEAIRRGQYAAMSTGQDVSAEAVVMEMMALYGNFVSTNAPVGGGAQATAPVTTQQLPTLPNIGGKGTSPTKKVPKSIADLHEARRAIEAAANS